jgi:hypothetical protein
MAGEVIYAYGTTKVLESIGASAANNTVTLADDANYDVVADGLGFPDAVFVLTGAFATAPAENLVINLYAQPLLLDGTNNADVPETTRPGRFIGQFTVNNVTTTQALELVAYDLPRNASYYIHNTTGQALSAGWQLRATPRTYKLA